MQKPEVSDLFIMSEIHLPVEVLHDIFLRLSVKEALQCMQVCKKWKTLLSDEYFWKLYIQKHFDLGIKSDLSDESPLEAWSGKSFNLWEEDLEDDHTWFCYFVENREDSDVYLMRPFPSVWNCGVVHPYGVDPLSGDVRSLQGFCRSLEILTYMKSEASRLDMQCGYQCSASEGMNDICAVIFPWNKKKLPTSLELQRDVFNFHPLIYEDYEDCKNNTELNVGNLREDKIYFHVCSENEDDEEHDFEIPCLNSIFGMGSCEEDEYEDFRKFYEWVQSIMCPSVTIHVGEEKFNPVGIFLLTQLAPGWVGGAMSAATLT